MRIFGLTHGGDFCSDHGVEFSGTQIISADTSNIPVLFVERCKSGFTGELQMISTRD